MIGESTVKLAINSTLEIRFDPLMPNVNKPVWAKVASETEVHTSGLLVDSTGYTTSSIANVKLGSVPVRISNDRVSGTILTAPVVISDIPGTRSG